MSDEIKIVNMSSAAPAPPLPARGEIVGLDVIGSRHLSTLSLAKGFGGTANPTAIWEAMVRDLPQAYMYYRELEEKDATVGQAMEMLKLSVLGRPREITPADESQQALDVADFVREQLDGIPDFPGAMESLLEAAGYGVSICEMIFDVSGGQASLLDIKDCPQELFTFGEQYLPQVGPLHFLQTFYTIGVGVPVPEEKFLIFSFRPKGRNRRGRPLLRNIFWPSWFMRNAKRFALRFAEKGPGTAAVMFPQGATDDEKQKALEAAENIVEKIAVAVPENFKLVEKLLDSARSQNPAVYKDLIEDCRMEIVGRILGQTLTTQGSDHGSGSRALGMVHEKMLDMKSVELARMLETVINNQLVRPLCLWNYGPNVPMPRWVIAKEAPAVMADRIKVDETLQTMGLEIPKAYARKQYGVPEPQDANDILKPNVNEKAALLNPLQVAQAAAGDPGTAEFAEARKQADKDAADVTRLMKQLKGASLAAFRQRALELVSEVATPPPGRGAQ